MKRAALFAVVAGALWGAPPLIMELQPRGAERGKPFKLTVIGRDLPEVIQIRSTMPAAFTQVLETDPNAPVTSTPGRVAMFLVEPKADLAPGVYAIGIEGKTGLSNVMLFTVGTFPEKLEEESEPNSRPNRNDSIETAEPVQSTPITLNGTLRGAERDIYRVSGKAGERRVFEVEARRSGSAIDPVLRILDGSGKLLARSEDAPGAGLDARLEFTFPQEGYYYVEIHDARFSKQAQNFYRLKMGAYQFFEGIFPLGGRRGEVASVSFEGGNAATGKKGNIDLRTLPAHRDLIPTVPPGGADTPMIFAVSDQPEVIEPTAPVQAPVVINGRLDKPGEVDKFRLSVAPGDALLIEMQARELGTSRIEGIVTAYGPDGKKLDSAGDKPLPEDVFAVQGTSRTSNDPFLNLKVPDGVREITLAVEDLAERGGPNFAYRVSVRKIAEDFRLSLSSPLVNIPAGGTAVVNVVADRRGYNGPIQLSVDGLPSGVRAQGGYIPREYVDANNTRTFNRRGVLILSADSEVALDPRELIVYGEGKTESGESIKRRARGPGVAVDIAGATAQGVVDRQRPLTAPWLGLDLPAALTSTAAATLEITQVNTVRMEEGDRHEFEYQWKAPRYLPFPNVLNVEVIGARDIRITSFERTSLYSGTFSINTTKATDPSNYDVIVRGRVKTESGDEDIYAPPVVLKITSRGGENATASSR
jgi:hypothetical protein